MAVSENDLIVGPLTPTAGVDTISLDFFFERAEWLKVFKSGSDVPLIQGTDYTVTGAGTGSGVVTLTTPANGTDSYSVFLEVPLERTTDLQLRGEFRSGPFNLELNRVWQALQGVSTRVSRALRVSRTSPALPPMTFEAGGTDGRTIVFNDDSTALVPGVTQDRIVEATASAEKAQEWAENPEDTEVEPGAFSAKHWAAKAESAVPAFGAVGSLAFLGTDPPSFVSPGSVYDGSSLVYAGLTVATPVSDEDPWQDDMSVVAQADNLRPQGQWMALGTCGILVESGVPGNLTFTENGGATLFVRVS